MNALDSTIDSLRLRGEKVLAIAKKELINSTERKSRYTSYGFGLCDELKALVLMAIRGWALYRGLRHKNSFAVDWYFNRFLQAHVYLVYFYELLKQTRPGFVITANDHNVPNRCMIAAANHLGIKTVYMQHASVTELFPALQVDYAFLDGQSALDTYLKCEKNQPPTKRNIPIPHVFLTGQKKHLLRSKQHTKRYVGVALNALDNTEIWIDLVRKLNEAGHSVYFRWHPGQPPEHVHRYIAEFSGNSHIRLSNPTTEHISRFLSEVSCLIAGNSSIHLEAALIGIRSIYYELTALVSPDRHGYVKHGLTMQAKSVHEVLAAISLDTSKQAPDKHAIRYYSATYQTDWDGREGELVADSLKKLSEGVDASSLFGSVVFPAADAARS